MIFQKAPRLISYLLISFLIAIPMATTNQRTDSKNRYAIGNCIYSTINTIPVEGLRENLTPVEFLGSFCTDLSVKEIERKCADEGLDIATEVKDCAMREAKQDLFQKYWNIGDKMLEKIEQQHEDLKSKLSKPLTSDTESLRVSSPIHVDEQKNPNNRQNPFGYEAGKDISSLEETRKKLNEFSVFAKGLCESPEFVRFEDIKDSQDKSDTLLCIELNISRFFDKIQDVLDNLWLKMQAAEIEKKKGTEVENSKSIPGPTDLNSFITDSQIAKAENPQKITEAGKSYLQKYDDIYRELKSKHLSSTDAQMDDILYHAFIDYESSIKWDCSLNNEHDIPFADWIEENVNKEKGIKHGLYKVLLTGPEFRTPSADDMLREQLDPSEDEEVDTSFAQ